MMGRGAAVLAAVGLTLSGPIAHAQEATSPFGAVSMTDEERARIAMPKVAFSTTAADEGDFEKYYVFHRAETDFATAFADISECDGYARGLRSNIGTQPTYVPYAGTLAGAMGGAIGGMMAAAIFGSAEKRRLRRVNMRTCMNFKGYGRYGLSKDLWTEFNFEEGLSGVGEDERRRMLAQQALVASGQRPAAKELGL
jgi:hypothetical protein